MSENINENIINLTFYWVALFIQIWSYYCLIFIDLIKQRFLLSFFSLRNWNWHFYVELQFTDMNCFSSFIRHFWILFFLKLKCVKAKLKSQIIKRVASIKNKNYPIIMIILFLLFLSHYLCLNSKIRNLTCAWLSMTEKICLIKIKKLMWHIIEVLALRRWLGYSSI